MTRGEGRALGSGVLLQLAFWAKNMTSIRNAGMQWPGFSYSETEWAWMAELADAIGDGAFEKFKVVTAVVFIALAAVGIALVFVPLASLLFPHAAETPAPYFVLLLAAIALLIIGIGLPLSMRVAAALSSDVETRTRLRTTAGDAELARKVAYQINRITAVMCGLLVPGALLFIAFNIRAGPIITALKWLSIAAMAVSIVYAGMSKPSSPLR